MKTFALSALLFLTPVTFPSKWGMSLDAKRHKHKEEKPTYQKVSHKEFREGIVTIMAAMFEEMDNLRVQIYELEEKINELEQKSSR